MNETNPKLNMTNFTSEFTHQVFFAVKNEDGTEDRLEFAARLDESQKLLILNGGRWYKPQGSLCPDTVISIRSGYIMNPLQKLQLGCTRDFKP